MKNLKLYIAAVVLFASFISTSVKANSENSTVSTDPKSTIELKAQRLVNRLGEIDAMDKSAMQRSEKRELNKEVRMIKKELKELSGGVYLSVGAVIIIILLLILLV
jgi:hypothetical protein